MSSKGVQKCKKCGQEFEMLEGESFYCSFQCDPDMPDKWQPITREQVNEWCKAQGMVVVPLEPTDDMLLSKYWPQTHSSCWDEDLDIYRNIIRAAQESSNE